MSETPSASLTPRVFERLYTEHAGKLLGYLTRLLRGNRAEAEGIVQAAFLKAWEKRETLKDMAAFRSWLYSIALNEMRQRKRKLTPLMVEDCDGKSEEPTPERHASSRQQLDLARAALEKLPEDQREAVMLVRMHNMKFREAAAILDVSENTVKTRVRRGLLKIAECLDE